MAPQAEEPEYIKLLPYLQATAESIQISHESGDKRENKNLNTYMVQAM